MGHGGLFFDHPSGDIEGDFTLAAAVFELYVAMSHGIVEDFFGDLHVLFAVLFDFVDFAFFPPADGLETMGGFFRSDGRFGDAVEAEAATK